MRRWHKLGSWCAAILATQRRRVGSYPAELRQQAHAQRASQLFYDEKLTRVCTAALRMRMLAHVQFITAIAAYSDGGEDSVKYAMQDGQTAERINSMVHILEWCVRAWLA